MTPNERSALLVASALAGVLLLILTGCSALACIAQQQFLELASGLKPACDSGDQAACARRLAYLAAADAALAQCQAGRGGAPLTAAQLSDLEFGEACREAAETAPEAALPDWLEPALAGFIRQDFWPANSERYEHFADDRHRRIAKTRPGLLAGRAWELAQAYLLDAWIADLRPQLIQRRKSLGGGGPAGCRVVVKPPLSKGLYYALVEHGEIIGRLNAENACGLRGRS